MLDLELGLEAGLEPEPEAGYSTASRRGSLARMRDAMRLFRQRNRRPAGDPGGIQEAQLSPRDRAMRRVNLNLANCHATVQKLLIRQVLTKSMV